MYLHIGGEYTLSVRFIVGIFDFDTTTRQTPDTLAFLRRAEVQDRTEIVAPDIPRSYVVTIDRVYFSPISAATLRKRLTQVISEQF